MKLMAMKEYTGVWIIHGHYMIVMYPQIINQPKGNPSISTLPEMRTSLESIPLIRDCYIYTDSV